MKLNNRFTALTLAALMAAGSCVGLSADETTTTDTTVESTQETTEENKTNASNNEKIDMSKLRLPVPVDRGDDEAVLFSAVPSHAEIADQ